MDETPLIVNSAKSLTTLCYSFRVPNSPQQPHHHQMSWKLPQLDDLHKHDANNHISSQAPSTKHNQKPIILTVMPKPIFGEPLNQYLVCTRAHGVGRGVLLLDFGEAWCHGDRAEVVYVLLLRYGRDCGGLWRYYFFVGDLHGFQTARKGFGSRGREGEVGVWIAGSHSR
jgi:hypothetical protein